MILEQTDRLQEELFAGRYKLVRVLGNGGMGTIFLAHDSQLYDTPVALKILKKSLSSDKRFVERFISEALTTRQLNHQGIIKIYDIDVSHDPPYFTLEYLDGSTVQELYDRNDLPMERLPWLLTEICNALSVTHGNQIIHRDIKPKNIIITQDWRVRLTDFGIATLYGQNSSDGGREQQIIGSGPYMAPEVWCGLSVTPLTDLYALGVMFYYLYTGVVPFTGETSCELMQSHLKGLQVRPIDRNPDMPSSMNDLIVELLDRNPECRPRSALSVSQRVYDANLRRLSCILESADFDPGNNVPKSSFDTINAEYCDATVVSKRLSGVFYPAENHLEKLAGWMSLAVLAVVLMDAFLI